MKKATQILRLLLIPVLVLALLTVLNKPLEQQIFSNDNIQFDKTVTTVLAGNSRLCVINPDRIPNAVNICTGGETYYFTYHVIKKMLEANPQVKNIAITCSHDNFFQDESSDSNYFHYLPERIEPYLRVLPSDHFKHLSYMEPSYSTFWLKKAYVPLDFENNIKLILFAKFSKLDQSNIPFYGKHHESDESVFFKFRLDTMVEYANKASYSPWTIKWYYKILQLSEEKEINLFLIAPPLHPEFLQSIRKDHLCDYREIIDSTIKNYPHSQFYDYSNLSFPDSCFGDWHHLNSRGSKSFADTLAQIIGRIK
jgi:hypothetical protein